MNIIALRLSRQHLGKPATEDEYNVLYRDTSPGQNVYWNGFGDPPTITYRASFDDMEYNHERQKNRTLVKGRFCGGNLGWIEATDLELFACAFRKPLDKPTPKQLALKELLEREGPMNIQQMKAETGMLVKEITPALHRLQEAFLIHEDQNDGEWDRPWMQFTEAFPNIDLTKYSRVEALKILLQRFAYRNVEFNSAMARSFYKLPVKDINTAIAELVSENILTETEDGYILTTDAQLLTEPHTTTSLNLSTKCPSGLPDSVYVLHRNDFLVKSNEHSLKEKWKNTYPDTLYYLLVDGEFRGMVEGKFRYTPEVENVIIDLDDQSLTETQTTTSHNLSTNCLSGHPDADRKDTVIQAIKAFCGQSPKRFMGNTI